MVVQGNLALGYIHGNGYYLTGLTGATLGATIDASQVVSGTLGAARLPSGLGDTSNLVVVAGNVGLGNTAPRHRLAVSGDGWLSGNLQVSRTLYGNGAGLYALNAAQVLGTLTNANIALSRVDGLLGGSGVSINAALISGNLANATLDTSRLVGNISFGRVDGSLPAGRVEGALVNANISVSRVIGLAPLATSGSWNDMVDKPDINSGSGGSVIATGVISGLAGGIFGSALAAGDVFSLVGKKASAAYDWLKGIQTSSGADTLNELTLRGDNTSMSLDEGAQLLVRSGSTISAEDGAVIELAGSSSSLDLDGGATLRSGARTILDGVGRLVNPNMRGYVRIER